MAGGGREALAPNHLHKRCDIVSICLHFCISLRLCNLMSIRCGLPAAPSVHRFSSVTQGTSRRGVLATIGAALAAVAGWRLASKLFGRQTGGRNMQPQPSAGRRGRLQGVFPPGPEHWVGDGFYVKTVFWPQLDAQMLSPFLLLDHAARKRFDPSPWRRGVGEHPHRGFETVTFAYEGEVEHRDSAGGGGRIGPGDVQWMTAASGVVHEEKHSQAFSERGGDFEMVQLWVNLPADKKMSEPRYQPLLDREFPRVHLGAAEARLVAVQSRRRAGPPRRTRRSRRSTSAFTKTGRRSSSSPRAGRPSCFRSKGTSRPDRSASRSRHGTSACSIATTTARSSSMRAGRARLVLAGEPLDEPVVAYGPFVMNTREEIVQAFRDYQSGSMGHLL